MIKQLVVLITLIFALCLFQAAFFLLLIFGYVNLKDCAGPGVVDAGIDTQESPAVEIRD